PNPVRTTPGCAQLAVTPVPSSLRASSRVNRMFASLLLAYERQLSQPCSRLGSPRSSLAAECASEVTVTTRAGADPVSFGTSRLVSRNGARWLTAKTCSNPSTVTRRSPSTRPALLMRTSMRSSEARRPASARTCSIEARSAISTFGGSRFGPTLVAPDQHDLGAHLGERGRCRLTDPGRRAGDYADLAIHGRMLAPAGSSTACALGMARVTLPESVSAVPRVERAWRAIPDPQDRKSVV